VAVLLIRVDVIRPQAPMVAWFTHLHQQGYFVRRGLDRHWDLDLRDGTTQSIMIRILQSMYPLEQTNSAVLWILRILCCDLGRLRFYLDFTAQLHVRTK
jgi:hypothetical protein